MTEQLLTNAVKYSAAYFESMYLDWFNNFLTVERFAEYYGMSEDKARRTINIGRKINQAS